MKKFFIGVVLSMLLIANSALAMTFQQPVEIGSIGYINLGGFDFFGTSSNSGEPIIVRQRTLFKRGIARFGDGNDALYFHYNHGTIEKRYKDQIIAFGSENIKNTVNVNIAEPRLYKIDSNQGITLYLIKDSYDIPEDNTFTLIGRRKDGIWVKYFSTVELTKKYFGERQSHCWKKFSVSNDVVSIYYELYFRGDYRNPTQRGEFRFKWDDKAQWFGIEHIVY